MEQQPHTTYRRLNSTTTGAGFLAGPPAEPGCLFTVGGAVVTLTGWRLPDGPFFTMPLKPRDWWALTMGLRPRLSSSETLKSLPFW